MNKEKIMSIFLMLILVSWIPTTNSKERDIIYVDVNGGADYTSIQEALNNAVDGDTIYAFSGIYYENIDINRNNINLIGEDKNTTIIDGNQSGTALKIYENNDNSIYDFTIRNASSIGVYIYSNGYRNSISNCLIYNNTEEGIKIYSRDTCSNNKIENCSIFNNSHNGVSIHTDSHDRARNNVILNTKIYHNLFDGIDMTIGEYREDTFISGCHIFENGNYGIHLNIDWGSLEDFKIMNSSIYNNTFDGLWADNVRNIQIENCQWFNNFQNGIHLQGTYNPSLIKNKCYDNGDHGCRFVSNSNFLINNSQWYENQNDGLLIDSSNDGLITNCSTYDNVWNGFVIDTSSNIEISDCESNNNYNGIHIIDDSYNNQIRNSYFIDNSNYGIWTLLSEGNLIYNNYFNNNNNTFEQMVTTGNQWNISKTPGTNIVGGIFLGGNYWSDYYGIDADNDGIGDTPYNIQGTSNQDMYPLGFSQNISLISNFIWAPENPKTQDIIQFNDTSISINTNISNWTWYFGDGNSSFEQNPTYQYNINGNYTVCLNITDDNGISNEICKTINISLAENNVSIPLKVGWNLVGWYQEYDTTAKSLSENITGCISVSLWDSELQTYKAYIVGGPEAFDFPISRGMGLFVDANIDSIWYGSG